MSSRKLFMTLETPYNKYKDTKEDVRLLTWSLDEAKVLAKIYSAKYPNKEGSHPHEDDEMYSDNFIYGHGIGIMTVSAESVRSTYFFDRCKPAVLKKFVTENSPPGTVIPTTKKLLLPMILKHFVADEWDNIIYAEDAAKRKAEEDADSAEEGEGAGADAITDEGVLGVEGSGAKKRKLDE